MKTIGITCDDYKLNHFVKEFLEAKFIFQVFNLPLIASKIIRIEVKESEYLDKVKQIERICKKLELSKPWKN